jgi:hypothetical protein
MLEAIGTKMALHFVQIDPRLPGRGRRAGTYTPPTAPPVSLRIGGHNLNHDR